MNKTTVYLRREYIAPAFRKSDLSLEKCFLASATGENMDPASGVWDEDDD